LGCIGPEAGLHWSCIPLGFGCTGRLLRVLRLAHGCRQAHHGARRLHRPLALSGAAAYLRCWPYAPIAPPAGRAGSGER